MFNSSNTKLRFLWKGSSLRDPAHWAGAILQDDLSPDPSIVMKVTRSYTSTVTDGGAVAISTHTTLKEAQKWAEAEATIHMEQGIP